MHPDVEIAELVARYRNDPLGYIRVAFPWGQPGTPLEHFPGPCPCQIKICTILGDELRKRKFDGHSPVAPIRIAVGTGHGIGKSALIGMLDNFIRSTRPRCKGMVLANTGDQLSTKTWAAIRTWNKLSITGHWFEDTTERIFRIGARDEWFSTAVIWSVDRPEAIAGLHAADSTPYYFNDECSGIADIIFEVQEGGLTDGEPIQLAFGNLTQPSGKFARIMNGEERGWIVVRIDSRECPLTNKDQIQEWVEVYGEDSDFVRVRVRGLAPRAGIAQYFDDDLIRDAQRARPQVLDDEPLIAACDFAWGGDDSNKIRFRCGLDMWSVPAISVPGEQTRQPEVMIGKLAEVLTKPWLIGGGNKGPTAGPGRHKKVSMLFCDSAGIAGPVVTRLRQMGFTNVIEVNFGAHSTDPSCKNVRAMMIKRLKEALQSGAGIDPSASFADDMRHIQVVNYVPLQFEEKKLLKKRLGRSTDDLDAAAMTYYMPVAPLGMQTKARLAKKYGNQPAVTQWT